MCDLQTFETFGGTRTEEGDAVEKPTVLEAYRAGKLSLPPAYGVEFDADLILLRKGGATAAAFSVAAGTTPSQVTKAAWDDYTRGENNSA